MSAAQDMKDFLATLNRERQCRVCGDTYTGIRDICEKEACFYGLQLLREEGRRLMGRPLDYVGTARKTFLVEMVEALPVKDPSPED